MTTEAERKAARNQRRRELRAQRREAAEQWLSDRILEVLRDHIEARLSGARRPDPTRRPGDTIVWPLTGHSLVPRHDD